MWRYIGFDKLFGFLFKEMKLTIILFRSIDKDTKLSSEHKEAVDQKIFFNYI
jgi:hypothetical protein